MPDRKPALALYQPDIAGNTGTLIRLSACLGTRLHIIDPAGFRHDDKALRRAGMDYAALATLVRHDDFAAFAAMAQAESRRIVLLTTSGETSHADFAFQPDDLLLLGRESSGVPGSVHARADARIIVPMQKEARSINQAVCGTIVLAEALRQLSAFPEFVG